jgi:membrane AbrB-like protein
VSLRRWAPWPVLGAGAAAAAWALGKLGLPSATLFAALLVGVTAALVRPGWAEVPGVVFRAAQAVMGVTLGAYLQSSSLSGLGHSWLPVALVGAATLMLSLGCGVLLSATTGVDRATGALGMVAGGASGIVTMARELGADDRLVAFMQYLRVLVVVLLTPLLVTLLFPGQHAGGVPTGHQPWYGDLRGWALTVSLAVAGALAARALRVPAGLLLGPMVLAAIVSLAVPGGSFDVPPAVRESAFALIGLQVGLRFTVATVREVGRLVVPVLLCIGVLLLACFGLAVALSVTTDVSLRDAYLATTPGGLYAVLAVAFGAGSNTTFVIATQGLRVIVMVLLAPVAIRALVGRRAVGSRA